MDSHEYATQLADSNISMPKKQKKLTTGVKLPKLRRNERKAGRLKK